jgi:hypothetical protein
MGDKSKDALLCVQGHTQQADKPGDNLLKDALLSVQRPT